MFRKNRNFVLISTIIGGGIGGYFSYTYNNYIFSGIGGALGYLFGFIISRIFSLPNDYAYQKGRPNALFLSLGFLMSVLGLVAYFVTNDKVMVIGCVFFLISSICLAIKK